FSAHERSFARSKKRNTGRMPIRKIDIRHFLFLPCNRKSAIVIRNFLGGHSSVGRAPALQAGSQGFESPCLQSLKGVEAKSSIRSHFRMHWWQRNRLASSLESFRGLSRRSVGQGRQPPRCQ